jgi:hypothetical protein
MSGAVPESGRYVYCIIKSPGEKKSFGNIGFGGTEVYTLEYRDLSPVISNAAMKKFEVSDEEAEVHKKVVLQVMSEHSVLPVAYGMVFKNKKLLQVAMSAGYKAMKKAVKEVDNKVELGVKIFLPKGLAGKEVKGQYRSAFLDGLKNKSVQSKELKLFSERLILNAAFLVDRGGIDDFSAEVERLAEGAADVKVQYSGPWPPYNFVDIRILSRQRGGFR